MAGLNSLVFKFFWKGKPDLVSRAVVVQPNCCGGFSVVDVNLKVSALLRQWIRRFASSPNSWVSFLVYWFNQQQQQQQHLLFKHGGF